MGKNNINNNKDDDDRRKKIFALLPFVGGVALLATVIGVSMPNVVTKLPKRSELDQINNEKHEKTLAEALNDMDKHNGFIQKLHGTDSTNPNNATKILKQEIINLLKTDPQSPISSISDSEKNKLSSSTILINANDLTGILQFTIQYNGSTHVFSATGFKKISEYDRVYQLMLGGLKNHHFTVPTEVSKDYDVKIIEQLDNPHFSGRVMTTNRKYIQGVRKLPGYKIKNVSAIDMTELDEVWFELVPKTRSAQMPHMLKITIKDDKTISDTVVYKAVNKFATSFSNQNVSLKENGGTITKKRTEIIDDLFKLYAKKTSSVSLRMSILSAVLGVKYKPTQEAALLTDSTKKLQPYDVEYWSAESTAFTLSTPSSPTYRYIFDALAPIGRRDKALELINQTTFNIGTHSPNVTIDPNNITLDDINKLRQSMFALDGGRAAADGTYTGGVYGNFASDLTHNLEDYGYWKLARYQTGSHSNILEKTDITEQTYDEGLKTVWENVYGWKTFGLNAESSIKRYPFLKYIPDSPTNPSELREHIANYLDSFFENHKLLTSFKYQDTTPILGSEISGNDFKTFNDISTNIANDEEWNHLINSIGSALGLLTSDDFSNSAKDDSLAGSLDLNEAIKDTHTLFLVNTLDKSTPINSGELVPNDFFAPYIANGQLFTDPNRRMTGGSASSTTLDAKYPKIKDVPLIQHSFASYWTAKGNQEFIFSFIMDLIFSKNPEEVMAHCSYSIGDYLFLNRKNTFQKEPMTSLWQWDINELSKSNIGWNQNSKDIYKNYLLSLFRSYDHSSSGSTPRKRSNHLPIERTLMTHEIYKSRDEEGDDE